MAFQPYSLWIDLSANRLTAGPGSEATQPRLQFIQGDNAQMNIHLLKRVDGILVETAFPAGSTLKVGVGKRESLPTGGSFNLSYASEDTADIPYNADAGDIADALNALTTVTSDGGVDVAAVGDAFIIKWLAGTSHTDITGISDGLYPKSIVRLANLQSPTQQTVFLHLAQSMVAFNDSWSPIAASVATLVDTVPFDPNGIAKVYRLEVTGEPISGYVNILYSKITGGPSGVSNLGTVTVDIKATATELYTALKQVGAITTDVIDVVKVDSHIWDITIDADDYLQITADSITSSKGRAGTLSFNTTEVHTFLAGSESGLSTIEVLLLTAAGEQTLLQSDCIIVSDIIDSSALAPLNIDTPLGENTANQRFIRRDVTQSPTNLELNNIWLNLGVSKFGTDVSDAINNSDSPTAGNPFATISDIQANPGPQGPAGPAGADGADGANGADGADGADGTNGADGANGANGADGAQGADGPQGDQGPVGPSGGDMGPQGPQGDMGPQGPQGQQGDAGTNGIVLTFRGEYNGAIVYSLYDVVYYTTDDNSYVMTQYAGAAGFVPTEVTYWTLYNTGGNGNVFTTGATFTGAVGFNASTNFLGNVVVSMNSSNAALRINQRGTGNAITVEDSVSPDATPFVVDQFGKVGIGVAPDATAAIKIDGNGMSFNGLVFKPTATAAHTGGTDTLDLLVTINGINYRLGLRPA